MSLRLHPSLTRQRKRLQRNRRASATLLLIGALLMVAIIAGASWFMLRESGESATGPLLHQVARGPFDHIVLEQGEVESSSNVEIRCEVKSRNSAGTQILSVTAEGTNVKKGDVLVKLDASALERDRDQQQITCNTSESIMIQAQNTYEAALISRQEYLEGTFKQDEQKVLSELFIAEQNLRTSQLSFKSGERLAAKGIVTSLQLEGDQFKMDDARQQLEMAQTKLKVLRDITQKKMLKQFDSDIASAKAKWKAEESSFELEKKKLRDIEDQIAKCEIRAPQDGQIVYANIVSSRGGSAEFVVEAGANVREGQVIVRLPDPSNMQVKAKINESRITLVKAGMPVLIQLDAFGDDTMQGEVTKVNQYAEPGSFFSSQVKEYATFIRINDPPAVIRPGLTAKVRIIVQQIPSVLQVPVQTIYEHGSEMYCLVKSDPRKNAKLELRKIKIGTTNDKFVTIDQGLEEKDLVVMDVRRHINRDELPKISEEDSTKKIVLKPDTSSPTKAATDEAPVAGERPKGRPSGGPGGAGGGGGGGGFSPDAMFARNDKNSDGKVDAEEASVIPEQFRARFMAYDTDGDGSVSKEEFLTGFARGAAGGGGGPPGGAGAGPPGGSP